MAGQKEKLVIIDGNALIHRSFHALPPTMTTKSGEMVNAVYGFTTVLIKAIREFKPAYVVLTLDRKGPTFRHKQFKDYKAQRKKAPDDLYKQIPRVKEIAGAFSIPIFSLSGFEADDLIGTITEKIKNNLETVIVTGDLDTLQLVDEHTKVYTMSRGLSDSVLYDRAAVRRRYGLRPEQIIDFKALRGDPSDNIPGVPGVGEKTAIELLTKFKTLDKIYKYINNVSKGRPKADAAAGGKIKPRIMELLKKYRKEAYLSKKLVTIKKDINLDFKLNRAKFGRFDRAAVVKKLSELEFKSLLPRIYALSNERAVNAPGENGSETPDKFARNKKMFKYYLVDDEKKFKAFLSKLKKQLQFAFDTETSSFDPLIGELLGISFCWRAGEAYYLKIKNSQLKIRNKGQINLFNYKTPVLFCGDDEKRALNIHPWLGKLRPVFETSRVKKFGHNIKFDIRVMRAAGVETRGIAFDTMVASYLLNPGSRQHNLDGVVFAELGHEKITKEDLLGKGREKIGFSEVDVRKLYLYSCEDADFTFRLVRKLKKRLKEQKLEKLFKTIEMPLARVLSVMEDNGVIIDKKFLSAMKRKLEKKLKRLEAEIYKLAGIKFNINSTQQLRHVLYEKLAIPVDNIGRTKTGLSTAAEELDKLKNQHPIIGLIQEYRELTKLTTTYINALPALINKKTGRVHSSFNQAVTSTGRLSSSDPNLQNIPIRTELGREIRRAFVSSPGYRLVSLDYSQIELRLAAHMSGDKKMIGAFRHGADIHTATAAEINQVNPAAVNKNMRREAKAVNFGILYGQGPHGLSRAADIPYWRAKEFIEQYFTVYRGIKDFINRLIGSARQKGYAETIFGRRRYLPEINSSVVQVRKAAERMAVNMPLQGTAADMIKVAMIAVAEVLPELNQKKAEPKTVRMLLQVHDELLFEIKDGAVKKAAKKIKDIMENVIKLKVPVIADVSAGKNWGEMKKIFPDE